VIFATKMIIDAENFNFASNFSSNGFCSTKWMSIFNNFSTTHFLEGGKGAIVAFPLEATALKYDAAPCLSWFPAPLPLHISGSIQTAEAP